MEDRAKAPASPSAETVLGGRYRILPDNRLPEYDSPGAPAYGAVDMEAQDAPMFALICDAVIPARQREMAVLRRQDRMGGMVGLKEWGHVPWGDDGALRLAVVFGYPPGARIAIHPDGVLPRISETEMVERLIEPALPMLSFLASRNAAHRAIRPDNLYQGETATAPLVFGECVTTPPGLHQPVVFETIERGMADRTARGQGSEADDLYALGVMIVAFLFGRVPGFGLSDDAIIDGKLQAGTYAWLLNRRALPRGLIEPIRGLVSDDPRFRWTVDDLTAWVADSSIRPRKQIMTKSPRPFTYGGHDYPNTRMLARAFARDWNAAAVEIRQGRLLKWVQRSGNEDHRGVAGSVISGAMTQLNALGAAGSRQEAKLVSQVCIALDPLGPIRFEGLSVMHDGIGSALVFAQGDDSRHRALLDLMRSDLPIFWLSRSREVASGDGQAGLVMRRAVQSLKRTGPGFGPERALYELNPGLSCQSPLVAGRGVVGIGSLLIALEAAAEGGGKPPFDRHIAAFVAARFTRDVDRHLLLLADRNNDAGMGAGTLAILAAIQAMHGPPGLPGIARWIEPMLGPVVATFSNRTLREKIESQVHRLVKAGNLVGLASLLVESRWKTWDSKMRLAARAEFLHNEAEIARLSGREGTYTARGQRIGYKVASLVSLCIGLFALVRLVSQHAG